MVKRQDPSITVGAFIINNKGELFLTKSHKWDGRFTVPSGHVEYGEKIEDALKREVKEETNLDIKELKFLCFGEIINSKEFHDQTRHFVYLDFACKAINNSVVLNDEAEEYVWVNFQKVLELNLDTVTRNSIELYIEKHK
jgi:nucleoside triphosphatase